MKEELKAKRKLSYLLNIWDDVNLPYIFNNDNVEDQVVDFFLAESELIYPAKSYFVAIVYAKCLEKYFGGSFFEYLNDPELLPDDTYFKTYSQDKFTYDNIINRIGDIWQYPSICKTVNYFKKEFLI